MTEPTFRRPIWIIVILFVSLAANGLLIGYVVGRGLVPGSASRPAATAPVPVNNVAERLKGLPADERQKFQEAMKPHRADIRQARLALIGSRGQLVQVLLTEPYNVDAMRRAFADIRAKTDVVQEQVQDATAQALAALAPESRKQLATQ